MTSRMLAALLLIAACKDTPAKREQAVVEATPAAPAFARAHAYEVALTLASLPEAKESDRALVERHRLYVSYGQLSLRRRYRLAPEPSATTITRAELQHALHVTPKQALAEGDIVELLGPMGHGPLLVVELLDPEMRIFERTQALTGATPEATRAQLRELLSLDLAAGTIAGVAWTNIEGQSSWWEPTIVEQVKDPGLEMSLRDARRMVPTAAAGQRIAFRTQLEPAESRPQLHRAGALEVTWSDGDFEALRPLAKPAATLEGLPAYRFYPEDHDVQYVEVPRAEAFALWKKLDGTTGHHAYVFDGDDEWFTRSRLAWRSGDPPMPQAAMHPMQSPEAVLAAVDSVDVAKLLAVGGNPSYPDHKPKHGPLPAVKAMPGELAATRAEPYRNETRAILIVRADAAWKGAAFMRGLVESGEATPSLAQAAAVSRHWETRYGARLAAMGPAKLEYALTRKLTKAEALALANEVLVFSPEGYEETVEQLAAALLGGASFGAWWD